MSVLDQIIIGAGLSGLTLAHESKRRGKNVLVLEYGPRPGGVVRSERKNDFLLEYGPNTVQPTPEFLGLIESLGLTSEMLLADAKLPRFVQIHGQLHAVPLSPSQFFNCSILNWSSKARLFLEPFIGRQKKIADESLDSFARRRLGSAITERLVAPFVSGIWGGDITQLSAAAAFPKLKMWEQQYGSLFRGMWRMRKEAKSKQKKVRGLISFPNGLQTIIEKLAAGLESSLKLNVLVNKVEWNKEKKIWSTDTSLGTFQSKKLILAIPAYQAASLLQSVSLELARTLESIEYSPLVALHMSVSTHDVLLPPLGFGFLVAPSENLETLGCIFNSNLFSGRAPGGSILLTAFMGGARYPNTIHKTDDELLKSVTSVLIPLLGLKRSVQLLDVTRYPKAIPQYTVGHLEREKKLHEFESFFPGLKFCSNFIGGVSVGDVVKTSLHDAAQMA